jgi:hypothetical protein
MPSGSCSKNQVMAELTPCFSPTLAGWKRVRTSQGQSTSSTSERTRAQAASSAGLRGPSHAK